MIRGDLERLHLGDLLQWLQMGNLSGRLTLIADGRERRLDFLEGRVVFASSLVPEERLATWLASDGILDPARLRRHLAVSLLSRTLFTDVLMGQGKVRPKKLRTSLVRLAETITTRVLLAPSVRFEFDPTFPVRDLLKLNLDLEPNKLLMEAARRSDEACREGVHRDDEILPHSGDAFETFFWEIVQEGLSGGEPLDGEQVLTLHTTIRSIMTTLAQWLASSPGLVPMPAVQVSEIERQIEDTGEVGLTGLPHAAWNQMVLACSVRSPDLSPPTTLVDLEDTADQLDLWLEMACEERWRRPDAGRLDELARNAVSLWSTAASAAAWHLEVNPGTAALAAHLLAVPTDLVLWVLANVPVPHNQIRQALVRHLPRRLGQALATRADLPEEIRNLVDPAHVSPLAACVHLGRATLPSAALWLATIGDDARLREVVPQRALEAAAAAAWEAVAGANDAPSAVG